MKKLRPYKIAYELDRLDALIKCTSAKLYSFYHPSNPKHAQFLMTLREMAMKKVEDIILNK